MKLLLRLSSALLLMTLLGCTSSRTLAPSAKRPIQFAISAQRYDNLWVNIHAIQTNGIHKNIGIPFLTSSYSIETPYAALRKTDYSTNALVKQFIADGRFLEFFSFRDSWGIIFYCPPYRYVTGGAHGTNGVALYQDEHLIDCFVTTPQGGITPVDTQTLQQGRACDQLLGLTAYFPSSAQPPATNHLPLIGDSTPLLTQGQTLPADTPGITLQHTSATINRNAAPTAFIQNDGLATTRTYLLGNGYAFTETDTNGDNAFESIAFSQHGIILDELQRRIGDDCIIGLHYDVSTNTCNRLRHELNNLGHYLATQEPSLIKALINSHTAITNATRISSIRSTSIDTIQVIRFQDSPPCQETIDASLIYTQPGDPTGLQLIHSLQYDHTTPLATILNYDYPAANTPFTLDTPPRRICHIYKPGDTNAPSIIERITLNKRDTITICSPKAPLVTKKSGSTTWQYRPPIEKYTRNAKGTPIPDSRRRLTTDTTPDGHTIRTYRDKKLILETTTDGTSTTHTYILPDGYTYTETDADGDRHYETITIRHNGQPLQTYTRRPNHSLIPTDLYPTDAKE